MRASYSPDYYVELPAGHPFPMSKFPALHELLLREGILRAEDVIGPDEAAWSDLRLVHGHEYLTALAEGKLGAKAERQLGLPWTPALWRRSRLAVQGTINASMFALQDGLGLNLAGGTHHAFADHGEGFCVLNDVAIAIRVLARSRYLRRAMVIDLDVHQGNGTAAILADDPLAYTFSMHGEKNFPFHKPPSSLDVGLPDGTGDQAYLDALDRHLDAAHEAARPELVYYLAGVDPLQGDRYGRLALTPEGLRQRDEYVLGRIARWGTPVVILLAGGYARTPELTAERHATVHRVADAMFNGRAGR